MALRNWNLWNSNVRRRKRQRRVGTTPTRRVGLGWDLLESRLAPAASTWSGAVSNLWSDAGNWDVPPVAGNDLVFPASAANLANTDDLAAGTSFASLTIAGSGYAIDGSAIALSGAIDSSQPSGSNTLALPIDANGTGPLAVTVDQNGAELVMGGAISGSGGLTLAGAGVLDLTGDLNLDSGSTFTVVLNADTAGSGYSQLAVSGQVNLGGATLDATAGLTPTGNESFTVLDNTGTGAVNGTFAGLPQGAALTISGRSYTISYTGGDGNDVVLTSVPAGQASTSSSLQSSVTSLVSGQEITLTANVAVVSPGVGTPTGTVEFFNGANDLGSGTLVNGQASLTTSALTTADTALTATYEGDDNFTTSTSSAIGVTVSVASTSTSVTVSPNPSNAGSSVTLTATVAVASPGTGTPTGSVEFFSGSTNIGTGTISNGVATLTTSNLAQGSNSITAEYTGDSNFSASTSPAMTATVNQASTTSLIASPSSFATGQTVTLTATVSPASGSSSVTPTGTVEFFNGATSLGSATLSSGVATLSGVSLTATSTLTATYEGDTTYNGSTSAGVTVPLVQTSTTTVTTAPNPSGVGQSVTLAAAVAGSAGVPTGDVMFLSNGIPVGTVALDNTGSALLIVTTLPAGSDAITAQYSGDANNAASTSAAVTQTVGQASSTTTLTVAPLVSSAGQSVTLSVNVAASSPGTATPTGSVTFQSGSTTLGTATLDANGNASLVTAALPVGTSTITAQYAGDTNFTASTSAAVTPTVNEVTQASTVTVTVTASTTNPAGFSSVQFTATVAPAGTTTTTPTGTVNFFANGAEIGTGTLDASGSATFSTASLALGSETIIAVYQGDSNYAGSATSPLSITVGTSDQLFVNQMYRIVLDRPAEQAGLTDWTTALQDGLSRQKVIQLIIASPEAQALAQQIRAESSASSASTQRLTAQSSVQYKEQRINDLYQTILGRQADPVGLQFYVNVVDDGFGARAIMVDLLGSDEYYSDITDALQSQSS